MIEVIIKCGLIGCAIGYIIVAYQLLKVARDMQEIADVKRELAKIERAKLNKMLEE